MGEGQGQNVMGDKKEIHFRDSLAAHQFSSEHDLRVGIDENGELVGLAIPSDADPEVAVMIAGMCQGCQNVLKLVTLSLNIQNDEVLYSPSSWEKVPAVQELMEKTANSDFLQEMLKGATRKELNLRQALGVAIAKKQGVN